MPRKKHQKQVPDDPQKSSAAQFLTYIASTGTNSEKYEIRYEDENIWMSQKMLAEVYGIEVNSINYHIKKIFADAELDERSVVRKIRITGSDGKSYSVNHYNLQVIVALGFKIDNERAVQFRKWANQIVGDRVCRECHCRDCAKPRRIGVREMPRSPGQAFHERLRPVSAGAGRGCQGDC